MRVYIANNIARIQLDCRPVGPLCLCLQLQEVSLIVMTDCERCYGQQIVAIGVTALDS